MEFNSLEFIVFFIPALLISISFFPNNALLIILIASLIFYAWNSTVGVILLLISAIVVHYSRERSFNKFKKLFITAFLIIPFIFFRTSDYLIQLLPTLVTIKQQFPESFILPAGVSFYTFQLIGYLWDKEPKKEDITLNESILFTTFFPQLIAGPIEKANKLIPQIQNLKSKFIFNSKNIKWGFELIALGFFLKTFFADILGSPIIFSNDYYLGGSIYTIVQIFRDGVVLYYDFLGYSFIAIGLGKIINIELTLNFLRPYASVNTQEFWRRWHVTLSTWFKDYIYKPICSRTNYSTNFIILGIILVFFLTGQWHGFGFRFLLWSTAHMILVILSMNFKRFLISNSKVKYFSWLINMIAINILWTFFLYDINQSKEMIFNLFFNFNFFQNFISPDIMFPLIKRFCVVLFMFASTVIIDPQIFINSRSQNKKELNLLDSGTVLNTVSTKISSFCSDILKNNFISFILILLSIFFFSYSKTFIYFRF